MKEKITAYQFYALMILLPYGTASLFYLAPEAKTDSWIVLLFYSIVSVMLQMVYISLYNKYPNDSIVTYLPKIYGKYIGYGLSAAYICYFSYIAYRNLRDFSELIQDFNLIRLPLPIIGIIFMIVITYSVYKGIENIGNMAQLALIIIIISIPVLWILLTLTPKSLYFPNVYPILKDGFINTIIKGYKAMQLPYSEFVTLTMLYPFIMQKTKVKKIIIWATITEGIILALDNLLFIFALGYTFAISNNHPLLEALRLVRIGDFLNRLDVIFIIILMLGGFFKICILIYCSVLGTVQLLNIKNWGLMCIVFGLSIWIYFYTQVTKQSYPEFMDMNTNHFPMSIIIPILSLIIYNVKKLMNKVS